jgi:hypothetical protein
LSTDDGDIIFEAECDEAITDIARECDHDDDTCVIGGECDCEDANDVKQVYGRIGNVYDLRTFSPMAHRINVEALSGAVSGSSVDITLNMDCLNLRRCLNDCSRRGICNPDSGTCTCEPQKFYQHPSPYFGADCSRTNCPNDCSGMGTCDTVTGQCTCKDRHHAPNPTEDESKPCTHVKCNDGPFPGKMECGTCTLGPDGKCLPVDFLAPTVIMALEINMGMLSEFLDASYTTEDNITNLEAMFDPTSPAGRGARALITETASIGFAREIRPDAVQMVCTILESSQHHRRQAPPRSIRILPWT